MNREFRLDDRIKSMNKIPTNVLLALCEISNYSEFTNELEEIISTYPKFKVYVINSIASGNNPLGKKEYKKFVKKYKNVFDIMKKYNALEDMILFTYLKNHTSNLCNYKFFYHYLLNHKDEIIKIKANVNKLSQLGINEIYFDQEIKFENYDYYYKKNLYEKIMILDNISIIPTYSKEYIKYNSSNSFYCIILTVSSFSDSIELYKSGRKVILNDLLFDKNKLPDQLNIENTIGVLKKLSIEEIKNQNLLRNSIDLAINSDELLNQYQKIKTIFESIESNKEETKKILQDCLVTLTSLKKASLKYENNVIEKSDKIDKKLIEEEKKLYLNKGIPSFTNID